MNLDKIIKYSDMLNYLFFMMGDNCSKTATQHEFGAFFIKTSWY